MRSRGPELAVKCGTSIDVFAFELCDVNLHGVQVPHADVRPDANQATIVVVNGDAD
jgi:hypothetical protein